MVLVISRLLLALVSVMAPELVDELRAEGRREYYRERKARQRAARGPETVPGPVQDRSRDRALRAGAGAHGHRGANSDAHEPHQPLALDHQPVVANADRGSNDPGISPGLEHGLEQLLELAGSSVDRSTERVWQFFARQGVAEVDVHRIAGYVRGIPEAGRARYVTEALKKSARAAPMLEPDDQEREDVRAQLREAGLL